jgi:transcriptional regulator with XRE-family HTH domain
MTQRDLAAKVGVGVPHVSKIEADRESPSDELIQRLAAALGADPDEYMLAARRVPPVFVDELAADPAKALTFLRTWKSSR